MQIGNWSSFGFIYLSNFPCRDVQVSTLAFIAFWSLFKVYDGEAGRHDLSMFCERVSWKFTSFSPTYVL